jgi:peptidoglycan/xylan/chitin deacetylase (PgdA/CDA1 family)
MDAWKKLKIDAFRWATMPYRWVSRHWHCRQGTMPLGILFYHRVDDEHQNQWTICHRDFERHINWLQKNFDLISLEELQRRMRNRDSSRPAISITFDDGYADNCAYALPMLIERKIPVTYFVTTEYTVSQTPFPHDVANGVELPVNSVESLKLLSRSGVEIGAHTRTHPNLGAISDEDMLFDEVITATVELEQLIGQKIRYFAFPFGQLENLNARVFQLLHEHGIEAVCSAHGGFNEVGDDPFYLRRFHGEPELTYLKNWLTLDPRKRKAPSFDWMYARALSKKHKCKKSCDSNCHGAVCQEKHASADETSGVEIHHR